MKHFLSISAILLLLSACGPTRHMIHVEMRYPSKAGIDLVAKNIAVVHLQNGNDKADRFSEAMADGLAYSLEQEYEAADGTVGLYSMPVVPGGDYSSKDTLINVLMDTGSDVVFIIDTLSLGEMTMGGPTSVASPVSVDSSYISTGQLPFTMKMYAFDAMNKEEKVYDFAGSSVAVPFAYSDGRQSEKVIYERGVASLSELGFEAGRSLSATFRSQWKHEQYSVVYFETEKWYKAMEYADALQWKPAIDIWLGLLDTNDLLKRSCAAYNLALATYMLGDYDLALLWLDRSDADNRLPMSETLRKRIDARK